MSNKDLIPAEGWYVIIISDYMDRQLSIPVVFWIYEHEQKRIVAMIPAPLGETADLFPAYMLGRQLSDGTDLSRYEFIGYGIGEDSPMGDQVISAVGQMGGTANEEDNDPPF